VNRPAPGETDHPEAPLDFEEQAHSVSRPAPGETDHPEAHQHRHSWSIFEISGQTSVT
jgi:hypothetical protein